MGLLGKYNWRIFEGRMGVLLVGVEFRSSRSILVSWKVKGEGDDSTLSPIAQKAAGPVQNRSRRIPGSSTTRKREVP